KSAAEYLNEAEDHGFSPDVCGYVKADYALQLRNGEHPRGRIPPPAVAVLTNACNTYLKWAEIWERLHNTPVITIDVPGSRSRMRTRWGKRTGPCSRRTGRRRPCSTACSRARPTSVWRTPCAVRRKAPPTSRTCSKRCACAAHSGWDPWASRQPRSTG